MARALLVALALALPSAARAQGCVGAALPEGRGAVQLQGVASSYGAGIDGPAIGGSLRANPRGPLGLTAEYGYGTVGDNDSPLHGGGAMLSLRAPLPAARLALCARGGVMAARLDDSPSGTRLDNLTFPVGLVLELPLTDAVVPYVAPQYLFSRTRGKVLGLGYRASGSSPGVEAGVGVRVGRAAVTAGGTFSDLADGLLTTAVPRESFFLRVGVLF